MRTEEVIPSLNKLLRMHWGARSRMKKAWAWIIKTEFFYAKRLAETYPNVRITSHRKQLLDYDNLVGGCKEVIVDNLKDLGLIKDDDVDSVKVEYQQVRSKHEVTEIVLSQGDRCQR